MQRYHNTVTYLFAIFISFPESDAVQLRFVKTIWYQFLVLDGLVNLFTNIGSIIVLFVFISCVVLIDPL